LLRIIWWDSKEGPFGKVKVGKNFNFLFRVQGGFKNFGSIPNLGFLEEGKVKEGPF